MWYSNNHWQSAQWTRHRPEYITVKNQRPYILLYIYIYTLYIYIYIYIYIYMSTVVTRHFITVSCHTNA